MRKLATIQTISDIRPIEGADAIEVATILGWDVVIKKGEYKVGDLVVYLEIDSWVPHEIAPFLTKAGQYPKLYNGVEGQRLKTIRLRGQVSQGLVLPTQGANAPKAISDWMLSQLFPATASDWIKEHGVFEGADVTEVLGILKWEMQIPAALAGKSRGSFPSHTPKTDQERIQNCIHDLKEKWIDYTWERTIKLDGSSMTMYCVFNEETQDWEDGVCSRNLNLKTDDNEGNSFVDMWNKLHLVLNEYCVTNGRSLSVQGELMGSGIQGNREGLSGHEFFVYDIWDITKQEYLSSAERLALVEELGYKHCPVLDTIKLDADVSVASLMEVSDNQPSLNNPVAEGIVYKSVENPSVSFKVISNKYLLEGGN